MVAFKCSRYNLLWSQRWWESSQHLRNMKWWMTEICNKFKFSRTINSSDGSIHISDLYHETSTEGMVNIIVG